MKRTRHQNKRASKKSRRSEPVYPSTPLGRVDPDLEHYQLARFLPREDIASMVRVSRESKSSVHSTLQRELHCEKVTQNGLLCKRVCTNAHWARVYRFLPSAFLKVHFHTDQSHDKGCCFEREKRCVI